MLKYSLPSNVHKHKKSKVVPMINFNNYTMKTYGGGDV
jgi:hypothetical protein